jgi:hypothetical protein
MRAVEFECVCGFEATVWVDAWVHVSFSPGGVEERGSDSLHHTVELVKEER